MMAKIHQFVTIEDRPQWSDSTGYGHHNGTYTGWWGYRRMYDEKIYSCDECIKTRMQHLYSHTSRVCANCYDWNYTKIKLETPKHYPPGRDTNLISKKYVFKDLLILWKLPCLLKNKLVESTLIFILFKVIK